MTAEARPVDHRGTWLAMLGWSIVSLVASFVLAREAVTLAADPAARLGCDLTAVVSCGTVGRSWQASVLGFPNAFLGLVSEPIVITLAVVGLSGVDLPRWFMRAAHLGYAVGVALAYWLLHQAVFDIGAVCPWCLLVTVATTFVFVELTKVNVLRGHLPVPSRLRPHVQAAFRSHLDVLLVVTWLLGVALLLVARYGAGLWA